MTIATLDPVVAAFGGADAVVERIDALDVERVRPSVLRRGAVYLPAALLAGAMLVAMGVWASAAQAVMVVSEHCPIG